MTYAHKFILILLIATVFACDGGESTSKTSGPLKVAYISHTYFVNQHADIQDMIIEEINAAKPDYVFALGDIVLKNQDIFWGPTLQFFSKMNSKVYYAPGNHDIYDYDIVESLGSNRYYPEWRKDYVKRIGYANKHVKDDRADFILINSNDPIFILKPFLDKALSESNPETPTVLLTHHNIWITRYQINWATWAYKKTKREEMLPYIEAVDQIVAGDLKGQLEQTVIDGTPTAMVGIGNMDKLPFWVLSTQQKDGGFDFVQKTIHLPDNHPYIYKPR